MSQDSQPGAIHERDGTQIQHEGRWRRNSLRRHSDVVEVWVVLVIWLLAVAAGLLAGVLAVQTVESAFSARAARAHAVSAVLTDHAARTLDTTGGYDDGRVWADVRWIDADGSVHTGRAKVLLGAPAGTRVTVWTDRTGRVVPAPVTGGEAMLQESLAGAFVAPSVGAVVWGAGWVVRNRLIRRRMAEWGEEWKQIGPRWGT
ncbi:Rv1733c family protein [Streptomyces sp. NPDC055059]